MTVHVLNTGYHLIAPTRRKRNKHKTRLPRVLLPAPTGVEVDRARARIEGCLRQRPEGAMRKVGSLDEAVAMLRESMRNVTGFGNDRRRLKPIIAVALNQLIQNGRVLYDAELGDLELTPKARFGDRAKQMPKRRHCRAA